MKTEPALRIPSIKKSLLFVHTIKCSGAYSLIKAKASLKFFTKIDFEF